jgi:hypothetical protein
MDTPLLHRAYPGLRQVDTWDRVCPPSPQNPLDRASYHTAFRSTFHHRSGASGIPHRVHTTMARPGHADDVLNRGGIWLGPV